MRPCIPDKRDVDSSIVTKPGEANVSWSKRCENGDGNSAKIARIDDRTATFWQRAQNAILRRPCAANGCDGFFRVYVQLRDPATRGFGASPLLCGRSGRSRDRKL